MRGDLLPLTRTDPLIGATTFGYDGFNRRTSVTDPNSVATTTGYDALDRVTAVTQQGAVPAGLAAGAPPPQADHPWRPRGHGRSTHKPRRHGDGLPLLLRGPAGGATDAAAGGRGRGPLLYLTTDHLGTPIQATDTAGAVVWEGGLEPFGAPFVFPGSQPPEEGDPEPPEGGDGDTAAASGSPITAATATIENAGLFLRFPGQWDDSSFRSLSLHGGLYYNVHRYYMPGTGRYTRPDPILTPNPISPFLYAGAQPTLFTDPLGLYRVTNHGSEHFATGSPKFKPDRVDADFSCECCGSGEQGWCLKFNIDLYYRFFFPEKPTRCTRAHENVHLRIFKTWVTRSAMVMLLPAERTSYGSRDACQQAGSRAKERFFEDLKRREGEHNREQRGHDLRVWLPEFFTCGLFGE